MATHDDHKVPLWGLFLALLALTAAEVGLYEIWSRVEAFQDAVPKFALVLMILIFTLPKAAIVLIYFMHLKFERQFIVGLALIPLLFAALAVGPTLTDAVVLKDRAYNEASFQEDLPEPTEPDPDAPQTEEPDPDNPFN